MNAITNEQGEKKNLREEPSEEDVARVVDCIYNHPRHRELLYKTIDFCTADHTDLEAEDFIVAQPEYPQALQNAYALLKSLAACGAIQLIAYDADGNPLGDASDEKHDASSKTIAQTTAAGQAALVLLDPQRRISACVHADPERRAIFIHLLECCRTPQPLDSINQLLGSDLSFLSSSQSAGQALHASYFIDRLNEAGGLVWDRAWVTTEAGKRFLASV